LALSDGSSAHRFAPATSPPATAARSSWSSFPTPDREGALLVAEKLRGEIEKTSSRAFGSITASLGSPCCQRCVEADDLLRKADRALYIASRPGAIAFTRIARAVAEAPEPQ